MNELVSQFLKRGEFQKAEDFLSRSQRVVYDIENHPNYLETLYLEGKIYFEKGQVEKGLVKYLQCFDKLRSKGGDSNLSMMALLKASSRAYRCLGEYESARNIY